jgi:hypothetical protein
MADQPARDANRSDADMPAEMHYVGFCRLCGTGPLGLRACGGCGELVVLCDECDAMWLDANFSARPQFGSQDDLPCPYCATSLLRPPSCWASQARIAKVAWLQTALQTETLDLQSGEPLVSESRPVGPDGPSESQSRGV